MIGLQTSVNERFRDELTHLPQEQAETLLAIKTAELESLADQISYDSQLTLTRDWMNSHNGQPPSLTEQIAINQRAQQIGAETALSQLWEGYRDPDDEQGTQVRTAMQMWPDTPWTPDEGLEELAAVLWPQHQENLRFVVLAETLLDARERDGLPIPARADEPLTAELEALVLREAAELAANAT